MLTPRTPQDWLVRKLSAAAHLTLAEREAVERVPIAVRSVGAGDTVVVEGGHPSEACLVIEGLLSASKTLPDGVRQITSLFVPGDIPDLQSLHLKVLDHALTTVTRARLGFIPHGAILRLAQDHPRLAIAFWRETLVYTSIYADWVVNLGGRPARERVAHLFCELHARLVAVGLDDPGSASNLTQVQLAEATGLSTVHVNRVLQSLRAEGLINKGRHWGSPDWRRLAEVAQFDPSYLHLPENTSILAA